MTLERRTIHDPREDLGLVSYHLFFLFEYKSTTDIRSARYNRHSFSYLCTYLVNSFMVYHYSFYIS